MQDAQLGRPEDFTGQNGFLYRKSQDWQGSKCGEVSETALTVPEQGQNGSLSSTANDLIGKTILAHSFLNSTNIASDWMHTPAGFCRLSTHHM